MLLMEKPERKKQPFFSGSFGDSNQLSFPYPVLFSAFVVLDIVCVLYFWFLFSLTLWISL